MASPSRHFPWLLGQSPISSGCKTPPVAAPTDLDKQLHKMLFPGSATPFIPTSSTALADQHGEGHADGKSQADGQTAFRKIGAGACGAIFAQDGKPLVFKLAKSPDHTELWNDYQMHLRIAREFKRHGALVKEVRVPECYFFVPGDRRCFWNQHVGLQEAAKNVCNLPTAALLSRRISPLCSLTRQLLIDKYCAPGINDQARRDPANRDCLVRVYLGSTQGKTGQRFFSLRNFKLHLNHMVDLELDTGVVDSAPGTSPLLDTLARPMGSALAVLHWGAKTDARDVEFVLGGSERAEGLETLNLLDFNLVRTITMDGEGVAMAVEAWRLNDPYYPKPCCEAIEERDPRLLRQARVERLVWEAFVNSYLAASEKVMRRDGCKDPVVLALPREFIMGIMEVELARMRSRKA